MLTESTFVRLRVFCEVVDSQGFHAASEKLNMSQPAISSHIQALEKKFQITLIERGRKIKLTDAGKIFYDYAKDALKRAEQISREMADLRNATAGRIAIASGMTLARHLLPSVLTAFKQEHPGVEIILSIGTQKQVIDMVLSGDVDFGFSFGKVSLEGLTNTPLAQEEIVLVVGPDHPLADRAAVTTEELSGYPFLVPSPNFTYSRIIQHFLESQNIEVKETLMVIEEAEVTKKIVRTGKAIGILIYLSAVDDIMNGNLKKLNLATGPYYTNWTLIARSDKYFSPIQNKFIKFCSTHFPILQNQKELKL